MDKRRKPAIREPRPEITLEEMRAILENITEIESATGIRYVKLHVTAKMIIGIRESSDKEFIHQSQRPLPRLSGMPPIHQSGGKKVYFHGAFSCRGSVENATKA